LKQGGWGEEEVWTRIGDQVCIEKRKARNHGFRTCTAVLDHGASNRDERVGRLSHGGRKEATEASQMTPNMANAKATIN